MSATKVRSSHMHEQHPHPSAANGAWTQYRKRCDQVRRFSIDVLPQKIDALLNALDSTTENESIAAQQCCCPLCIQVLFDRGHALFDSCSICQRRCCDVCSFRVENSTICRSQTCILVNKFIRRQLSSQALAEQCDLISRDLLRQWVVLQLKGEILLGPLRALTLVDARNAALCSIAAKSGLQNVPALALEEEMK